MKPNEWDRIETLFGRGLTAKAADREALLCLCPPEIAAAVRDLWQDHDLAGDFLVTPVVASSAEHVYVPGDLVSGRFRILDFLASGGMGEVYVAADQLLQRNVAIKVLSRAMAPWSLTDDLQQEANAVCSLVHPRICALFDLVWDHGRSVMVMEYLEGETLAARLQRGPVEVSEAMRIASEMLDALAYAHARGVIHRDIKPSNIMVTPSGSKLLDFGIAVLQPMTGEGISADDASPVAGSISYMSPEQASGKVVDSRSDVFSFGALLYEMLSGNRAFNGSIDGLTALIRDEPPPLKSPMAQVVAKCMAKLPAQRFQSMEEVRAGLEQITTKAPAQHASIAVLPFVNISSHKEQDYFSDGLAEEIINLLVRIPNLKVIARTSAFAFRGKERDIRRIAEALDVSTVLKGSVRRVGKRIRVTAQLISADDGSHLLSERYDREMTDIFAVQDEIAAAIAAALRIKFSDQGPDHRQNKPGFPEYEAVLKALHYIHKLTPDSLARGREYLAQAITLNPEYARPHCELALHFMSLAFLGVLPAHQAMRASRDAARRALEIDPLQPADAVSVLGFIAAVYEYDWKEAGRLFGLALRHGQLSPIARVCYSHYLIALGRTGEAIQQIENALTGDPLNPFLRLHLAMWLGIAGRYGDSAKECRRILELDEDYGLAWVTLSIAILRQGEFENAVGAAERAVTLIPWSKGSQGYLAGLLALVGDEERAVQALQTLGDGTAYGEPLGFTCYYMICGEIDQAANSMTRAIEQRSPTIVSLLRGPLATDLRKSPRAPELAKQLNLSDVAGASFSLELALDPFSGLITTPSPAA